MGVHTLQGNPPITVKLRQSARAKRLSLRVSRLDGQVTLTLPRSASRSAAFGFLHDREDWLRQQLEAIAAPQPPAIGGSLPFRGRELKIAEGLVRRVEVAEDSIIVPQGKPLAAQIRAFLRHQARDALAASSDHYAAQIGRSYQRLSLRDTRSRWGSCTSDGRLMYSWRLIMAPPDVLDYVAAHEVAHLVEMNHSVCASTRRCGRPSLS